MSANQKKRGENMLSVIIPAYNEEKMIQTTADTVDRILSEASVPYEKMSKFLSSTMVQKTEPGSRLRRRPRKIHM